MARARSPYRGTRIPALRRAAVLVVILVIIALVRWWQGPPSPAPPEVLAEGMYWVERAVDGDTLLLGNGVRVRLIGVNTPETVKANWPVEPFGPEAKEFTARFVAQCHGQVRLQLDRERKDKFGRLLAYVWAGDRLLNEELIREGLGKAELQYPYTSSMKTRFRHAEEDARAASRGIWSQPATRHR